MKSTADRYREAGMPPPRGPEAYVPLQPSDRRSVRLLEEAAKRAGMTRAEFAPGGISTSPPLPERVHDPADPAALPELPEHAYGPDSVPLDPDADTTEETS